MNGTTGSSSTHTAATNKQQQQQQPFRRTVPALLDSELDQQHGELEDDGANDLVESISQSLRQGQQVKPITYEEGPCYNTSLDKLKSKYIVLKATTPNDSSSGGGSLGNSSSTSSSSFGAGLSSKASAGGAPNTHLTMNGGGSLKFSASQSPSAAKSSANVLQQQSK